MHAAEVFSEVAAHAYIKPCTRWGPKGRRIKKTRNSANLVLILRFLKREAKAVESSALLVFPLFM